MSKKSPRWAAPGDVNAFFGLMLDNIADLLLTVGLLSLVFEFPTNIALRYMVPGTAIGVLVGDLLFFAMALKMARRTGRSDITAMPLGLDTPSTFGMVFFVLGQAFIQAKSSMSVEDAAIHTWHIGICCIVASGIFKFLCALGSSWIRRVIPRAGLLGSLAAIALVLISFIPLLEVLHYPVVGLVALAVILTTLVARVELPFRVPGALGALIVGCVIYYIMFAAGLLHDPPNMAKEFEQAQAGLLPTEWLGVFSFEWLNALDDTWKYLPIVIPFALGTVVGGIDCTESAAAAGDEFHTGNVIGVEAFATLVAGLCGGVIQTTPYIGHPAYKAMGGRSAYTLATALFVGSAGVIGYFGYMYAMIPKPTVFPILIFIGLEITAQSFLATPRRHYPAIAFACVPALAALGMLVTSKLFGDPALISQGINVDALSPALAREIRTMLVLSNGFIITSLLWASALAMIIDRKLVLAAGFFLVASVCSLFGVIHSPFADGQIFAPWHLKAAVAAGDLSAEIYDLPLRLAVGYALVGVFLLTWAAWRKHNGVLGEEAGNEYEEEADQCH